MLPDREEFCDIILQVFLSLFPEYVEMILLYYVVYPIKSYVYCYGFFFDVPFTILFAAVLSVATGVGGCGWTISSRTVHIDVDFWQFSNNPPNSASVAYAMSFLLILHSRCTVPFSVGIYGIGVLFLDFGSRKKYPPALLHASGSEM